MQIDVQGNFLRIRQHDQSRLQDIRSLPGRRWDGRQVAWLVPYVREVYATLRQLNFPVGHLPEPARSGYSVDQPLGRKLLVVRTLGTVEDVARCRKIPGNRSYSTQLEGWCFVPTAENVEYVRKAFPQAEWTAAALEATLPAEERKLKAEKDLEDRRAQYKGTPEPINDFKFPVHPYNHQVAAFALLRDCPVFALFMEQGTGKTYVIQLDQADRFLKGEITGTLVICPNAAKSNWEEELPQFMPKEIELDIFVWEGKTRHKAEAWVLRAAHGQRPHRWLIMNVDAFSSEKGRRIAELFLSRHTCSIVVDESAKIKSPMAARTKAILKLSRLSKIKRIMSGLPITHSPLDLFTQFKFLDPDILGYSSYYTFRNHFAILGGFNGKIVTGFVNLEELQALTQPHTFRVLKVECLDLPKKLYIKRYVDLTDEQQRAYEEMRDELKTEVGGFTVTETLAIVKIMRLQQIVGGFLPVDHAEGSDVARSKPLAIPGGNPKLESLLELIEELADDKKVIIWAHFRPELRLVADTLEKHYGAGSVVRFWGGEAEGVRNAGRRAFAQRDAGPRFFVGQPAAGGIALNLVAAHTVVYFSNGDSLEDRIQSEDRAHRIGQDEDVTYIDLTCRGTTDVKIIAGLRNKKSLADLVHGDPKLGWI